MWVLCHIFCCSTYFYYSAKVRAQFIIQLEVAAIFVKNEIKSMGMINMMLQTLWSVFLIGQFVKFFLLIDPSNAKHFKAFVTRLWSQPKSYSIWWENLRIYFLKFWWSLMVMSKVKIFILFNLLQSSKKSWETFFKNDFIKQTLSFYIRNSKNFVIFFRHVDRPTKWRKYFLFCLIRSFLYVKMTKLT